MPVSAFLLTAPELLLSLGAIILMMVAAFAGDGQTRGISIAAVAALVAAAFLAAGLPGGLGFGGLYRADAFSAFGKVLIYAAAAVSIIIAPGFFARTGALRAEYPVLIMLSSVGMGMMVSAGDLLTLYVGLELQSLAAYVLASFMRRDARSAEAGLKYFVLGALASGILLYGISLLYGFTGTTLFDGISRALATPGEGAVGTGRVVGLVFVLAGIAFKISAVPFHMWTPDVYEGAPTPVTAFFASAPKIAAMGLLARVAIEALGPESFAWQQIVIFSALASVLLGGVAAVGQTNIKRLLAYSSINNVGFALIGIAAGTPDGIAATMSYMAVYVVMTLGSFLCVLRMRDASGQPVEAIAGLAGLSRTRPALAASFAMLMFSLAGIPPLFGFWPKFLVFDAATANGLFWLAAIAAAMSVISAYYYLRIIKVMFFDEPTDVFAPSDRPVEAGLLALCTVAISPFGYLLIVPLGAASLAAARALFAH
jgi:NADH-quinone oxidoreductase subunit N